jgi:hypothetical protein
MLDYLPYEGAKTALANVHRILRPRAVFRLVVQDCSGFMRGYLDDTKDDAAIRFMEKSGWGRRHTGLSAYIRDAFGHGHRLWMWDAKGLKSALRDAGFSEIRDAAPGDSGDPMFEEVENSSAWFGNVGIECRA